MAVQRRLLGQPRLRQSLRFRDFVGRCWRLPGMPTWCGASVVIVGTSNLLANIYPIGVKAQPFAATTVTSKSMAGVARLASTVVRAGVAPAGTQASQTAFMAAKSFMLLI